jgi:uncharacterized protein with HEPN domain
MNPREKTAKPYIAHILESIARIREYTLGGKASFANDPKTYDAVIRRLHTLAEASFHLPQEIKSAHPTIPWEAMVAFRHILVHEYLGTIDNDKVWHVITERLPELEAALECYRGEL